MRCDQTSRWHQSMRTRLRAKVRTEDQIDGAVNQGRRTLLARHLTGQRDETEHMLRAIVAAVIQ